MSAQGHHPTAVANEFIELSGNKGIHLTKILKLSYIAHGITLAVHDKPLVDEYAEAWKYGPIFPTIYHEFKRMGPGPITQKVQTVAENDRVLIDLTSDFSSDERAIIRAVYERYKDLKDTKLVAITHAKNGPWEQAWERAREDGDGQPVRGFSILNQKIKEYYRSKAREPRRGVS